MNKKIFDCVSHENQATVARLARHYSEKLVRMTRKDDAKAIQVLDDAGIELLIATQQQIASFRRSAEKNYEMSIPSLDSRELVERISGLITDYRQKTN